MSNLDKVNIQNSGLPMTPQKLSLFFNYILQFKIGQKKSYTYRETHNLRIKQHNRSNFRNEQDWSNSSVPIPNSPIESFNIGSDITQTQQKPLKGHRYQPNISKEIHYGFSCDKCYTNPIVGQRYHCELCDYDICSQCYTNSQPNYSNEQTFDQNISYAHGEHEHPLVLIQRKICHVSGINQVLLSMRREKCSTDKRKQLMRSQKLRLSNR